MKWNENEINFLKKNYPSKGLEYCSSVLNRNKGSICSKANKIGLFLNPETKSKNIKNKRKLNNYKKYNVDNIINISNNYSAYFLGYLWADGHIRKESTCLTTISLIAEDAKYLFNIVNNFTNCFKLSKPISKSWTDVNGNKIIAKNQLKLYSFSQELYNFLLENDYDKKSNISFNKIWKLLDNEKKNFFILGLIDGDGSFNYQLIDNKYDSGELVITSSYNYDWSIIEEYFIRNKIDYKIYNLNVKLGQVSRIVVRKKMSLIKLFELIYCEFHGLDRKYLKFLKYYEKIKK